MVSKVESMEKLFEKFDNKYAVIVAVAKRAREIHDGSPLLVKSQMTKPVTQAMEEFVAGAVEYEIGAAGEKTKADSEKTESSDA